MRLSTETETGGHDYGKRSTYLGLGILLGCVFTLTALCFRGTEELVKQSYSTFAPLDGKFDSNVILQIKNGPVRFACVGEGSSAFWTVRKARPCVLSADGLSDQGAAAPAAGRHEEDQRDDGRPGCPRV